MSNYLKNITYDDDYKFLYAIVRKPQEGKTFICLKHIEGKQDEFHIVITMNTIKSNNQFYERSNSQFNGKVITFNSKYKTNSKNHTNNIYELCDNIIEKKMLMVIMCGHQKRFTKTIKKIILKLNDSKSFNKKIILHIDEAHEYVPKYRKEILELNNMDIVNRIILYSATPFKIWHNDNKEKDIEIIKLFSYMYIVNIEKEYGLKKNKYYFGVKDCNQIDFKNIKPKNYKLIDDNINKKILKIWETFNKKKNKTFIIPEKEKKWLTSETNIFSLGDEQSFLTYIKHILTYSKNKNYISNNKYSYNFIPAYKRKITHFGVMFQILEIFNNALVFMFNGDGSYYYYKNKDGEIKFKELDNHNEISLQIELLLLSKSKFTNRPVFVTGLDCINMSITLINENLGNFDNVFFSHSQFMNNNAYLYQMCRFLFNYISWNDKTKIKKTNLFLENIEHVKNCLKYEKQIDVISNVLRGNTLTLEEASGGLVSNNINQPPEVKYKKIEEYVKVNKLMRFSKDEHDDEEDKINNAKAYYKKVTGRELKGKSMPKKNDNGFYECSITQSKSILENVSNKRKELDKLKWYSNYQLTKNKFKYARVYIVYDDINNNSEYSIFIRSMEIEKNETTIKFLEDEYKNRNRNKNINININNENNTIKI